MARNSSPGRQGGQKPPFEIVLDEGCSIICDDMPVNCTIRVLPVDGRSPPRMSPVSQWGVEDYSPGGPSERSSPSPTRSRRSIVESMRRNIQENTGTSGAGGIHTGYGGAAEGDVFSFRKSYCKHECGSPSPTPSFQSAASYYTTAPSRQPTPPPPPEHSANTDRLLNPNRPQMDFRRANIYVDGTDLREMHPNSGPPAGPQQSSNPALQQNATKPLNESQRPQTASTSSSRPSSPPPSRPSPSKSGGRCCGMAEYNPSNYRSKPPEKEGSKTPEIDFGGGVSVSGSSTSGGSCSHHGTGPCPTRAGSRCRENRGGQGQSSSPGFPQGSQRGRSCDYHNALPCPVLAGVPCRGEIQKSGASSPSTSRPASPDRRTPRSPGDLGSQSSPELKSRPGSPGGSAGVAYPPRTISPPPKTPRSRTPSRRPLQKCKGVCL
ncbi:unnamed protein product [Calypogeia fissa]